MATAKKEKVVVKKQPKKSNELEKHIEFIYAELEDLRDKLEKVLIRMGL
jgi:hypothetical protein|tara:strand:+ start:233 stop:379 length:147 start_codon:yes stop_codon:yes gene_type:complete